MTHLKYISDGAIARERPPRMLMLGPSEIAALSLLIARIVDERELAAGAEQSAPELRQLALSIYQSRRHRDYFFDSELFSDPAWDMLLAAYCLGAPDRELTVTGMCHASSSPPTTALRWVERLTHAGMLKRRRSKQDGRMTFVSLTSKAREQIEAYLLRVGMRYISLAKA